MARALYEGMSAEKPIRNQDLAYHWGCSAANVSNLVKRHAMPEFTSLADADAWRAVHAPTRKPVQTSPQNSAASAEKSAGIKNTTTPADKSPRARARAHDEEPPPPAKIDVNQFIDHSADFIALQLRNAKESAQIAHGLLKLKMSDGEPGAIAAATKNWHETSKAAADIIEKFLELQREAGTLIPIDDVEDVIATELEEIRKGLRRLGKRIGLAANPAAPDVAERAINAEVDHLLAKFNNLVDRARLELAEKQDELPPDAVLSAVAPDPSATPAAAAAPSTP